MSREDAYALVQAAAMETWQTGTPLREALRAQAAASGHTLDEDRLDEVCRPERYVARLGPVFERLERLDVTRPLTLLYSGKVRDVYERDDGVLLLVASDRISAFDHVLQTPIPDKGKILTQLSLWWFEQLADVVPNHLVDADIPAEFAGRAMACRRLSMVPVECVARGYLAGSGLAGIPRRPGRSAGCRCRPGWPRDRGCPSPSSPRPPRRRAASTTRTSRSRRWPPRSAAPTAAELRADHPGGVPAGRGDRRAAAASWWPTRRSSSASTPAAGCCWPTRCSPRIRPGCWPAGQWQPGKPQVSFDKQIVRDWLDSPEAGWEHRDREPPPPLPGHVVEQTRASYIEAYERITGRQWV